ncbi:MAG TPA: right-handed parallel beta-helix repeat-containing protein [Tepidisphaeraceae bacterium]|nr:right-handed parallel beta-helix repeat-containing protein [Tepidisphaeraceae bacterium]
MQSRCSSSPNRRPDVLRRFLSVEELEPRVLLTAWYVSTAGDSTNPGTLAQPFGTIQAAANVAQPGDTVYIMGGTYHETVTPANSGTAGSPITYEPYNDQPVTIDGADPVTGWTSYQGKIYDAPQLSNLGEGNNQVFIDGKMVNEARFPNSPANVSTPTWAKATSVKVTLATSGLSTVTIYDSALTQPAGAWVGAVAHIAAGQEWVAQSGLITASAPGSITVSYYQETSYQVPKAGNRFYIVGNSVALDTSNEWYRDPGTGLLYLWDPTSDSPANHTIEAKARLYGFDLSNVSYVTVQGINLFACTVNTNAASTDDMLNRLTATYVSQSIGITADTLDPWGAEYHAHATGIILNGTGNILENSTIAYSSGDGVFLGGSGNTVENTTIHDVDYEGGDEAGVTTLGNDESVLYNTIYNTGRSGIVSRFTTHSLIAHNVVHDVGLQMTDLGAIYTWGTDGEGTEIAYNVCYNVHTGGYGAAGIYLDNGSQNWIVDHNVVYNADFALKMNPPDDNDLIINNTFSGTQYGLQSSGNEDMTGSTFLNNIFTAHAMFGPSATYNHDIFYQTNPQFVNAAAYNFQIKSNSPAINAGVVMPPYTNGYLGKAPDIGAYEYGQTPFAAGATAIATATTPTTPVVPVTPPAAPSPVPASAPSNSAKRNFNPQAYTAEWGLAASGSGMRFTNQWGWVEFQNVDFGAGVSQIVAQLSKIPAAGLQISIRLDGASAASVGMLVIPPTKSGSTALQTFTAALKGVSGVHNLYLVLATPPVGGELDGFTFA